MSDVYVRFQDKSTDEFGTWYRLISRGCASQGDPAVRVWPDHATYQMRIVSKGESCQWKRTEYTEDEVPDELWRRIALRELGISNTEGED